ncbi:hypothetical protein [Bdellovibrio bacteriovorus]|uniref:hypothetical protein n=1 Tax=Bdellovibrio bacteriovorus TaxID=959 RepID=UPI0035A99980
MIKSSRVKVATVITTAVTATAFLISACSGGGSDPSTAAALTISGGFSGVSLHALTQPNGEVGAFAATDYTVICSMMVEPFTSGNSALDSNGVFSLSIAGASGQPIGCMIVKSGKRVADFEFQAAETGMTGATGGTGLAVNNGATAIQLPSNLQLNGAVVSVPVAEITQNSTVAPTVIWADPTGTWSIAGFCRTELDNAGTPVTTCLGAQSGDDMPTSVYLKQLEATNAGATKKGLSVWRSAAARTACGDKEGITLDGGWTATGDWAGKMTGGVSMDISTDQKRIDLAALSKVRTHDNGGTMTAVCGKTKKTDNSAIVSGTTLCSEVAWDKDANGNAEDGGWGMNAKGCQLYCVMGALNNGEDFNWGASTCKKRYRARWENNFELATDTDYQGPGATAGAFANGTCSDTTFDGCKSGSTVLFEAEKADDQFMIGELFISGNIGTLMDKHHFTSTFQNAARTGTISCGGTHMEKMTITQVSATTASVVVEHSFVADANNSAECATNDHFSKNAQDESSMILKLVKQ